MSTPTPDTKPDDGQIADLQNEIDWLKERDNPDGHCENCGEPVWSYQTGVLIDHEGTWCNENCKTEFDESLNK